ncbi:murein L,D-transpeptidase catalytic domain-containing protein [Sediminitomix flava]|uniref:L,D-transpeptidase-like protein n=1 Tax=Sediminitomix flava TaxID=379075 RepID=A0A315ZCH0_SEDFL|nr:murein L,D-transpeptidase catalytic domain family protein [Sediminitomix flava]PWJ42793.1 L,D-transpeptidase-like protein [Sediminitomix flava]
MDYFIYSLLSFALLSPSSIGKFWTHENTIDQELYQQVISEYENHTHLLDNHDYVVAIDLTKPSFVRRFYLIDLKKQSVESFFTTHGHGGSKGNIFTPKISNIPASNCSVDGALKTAEVYKGKYGRSLRLEGIWERNTNTRKRDIVIHPAYYASSLSIYQNLWEEGLPRLGESQGCPALPPRDAQEIITKIKEGALIYIHSNELEDSTSNIGRKPIVVEN